MTIKNGDEAAILAALEEVKKTYATLENLQNQYNNDFEKLVKANLEVLIDETMSAEEVAAKVSELIAAAGLEPIVKNKGMIMKTVMAELKGKADGKVIGAAVDALLS